jgi:enamine deaminase RidA (YjgF/YER057c/UK114 family)
VTTPQDHPRERAAADHTVSDSSAEVVRPEGWAPARGYSDAIMASGRVLVLAGQIGWDPATGEFESDDFAAQTRRALQNIMTLLRAAGAEPEQLVRMTWFITSRPEYLAARREIGQAYREIIGRHYPAMSVVVVSGLLEERAKVEIEATAVISAR